MYEVKVVNGVIDVNKVIAKGRYNRIFSKLPESLIGIRIKGAIEKINCGDTKLNGMLDMDGNLRPYDLNKCYNREVLGGDFEGVVIIGSQKNVRFTKCNLSGALDNEGKPMVWDTDTWMKSSTQVHSVKMIGCQIKGSFKGIYLEDSLIENCLDEDGEKPFLLDFDENMLHYVQLFGIRLKGDKLRMLNHAVCINNCMDENGDTYVFDFDKFKYQDISETYVKAIRTEFRHIGLFNIKIKGSIEGLNFYNVSIGSCKNQDDEPFVFDLSAVKDLGSTRLSNIRVVGSRQPQKDNEFVFEDVRDMQGNLVNHIDVIEKAV